MSAPIAPLVRYVGGKRKLAAQIVARAPREFARYVEPFCGGAAVFCELWNSGMLVGKHSVLNDVNPHLMRMYADLKHGPATFLENMQELQKSYQADPEKSYYAVRDIWNGEDPKKNRTAARYVFLKQASFNGLWRTSKTDKLNASWGKLAAPAWPTEAAVMAWSAALREVSLHCGTYRAPSVGHGDLVYLDPPYVGTFDAYTAEGFDRLDNVQLLGWVHDAVTRGGAHVLYSNSMHALPLVQAFWPRGEVHVVDTTYAINSDGAGRANQQELLVVQHAREREKVAA